MSRTGLRKARHVPLTGAAVVELRSPGGASLVAVFHDEAGRCLETVADDRRVRVDPRGGPAGTARVIVAVEVPSGRVADVPGLGCEVRDDDGAVLAGLVGPAAGGNCPDPVHLLGECHRHRDGWWFREIGHGLADDPALARTLGPGAAEHHRRRRELAGPPPDARRPRGRPVRALPPANLESARLVGDRLARGPVSLEVAVDVSRSMRRHTLRRRAAMRALADFARREMAVGDLLTSVAFAGSAAVMVPPVDVRELGAISGQPRLPVIPGTNLNTALSLLYRLRARCPVVPGAVALMVISDLEFFDSRRAVERSLRRAGYADVHLVVPGWGNRAAKEHRRWIRRSTTWRFRNADQLGLAYASIYARMTGQWLERG